MLKFRIVWMLTTGATARTGITRRTDAEYWTAHYDWRRSENELKSVFSLEWIGTRMEDHGNVFGQIRAVLLTHFGGLRPGRCVRPGAPGRSLR